MTDRPTGWATPFAMLACAPVLATATALVAAAYAYALYVGVTQAIYPN